VKIEMMFKKVNKIDSRIDTLVGTDTVLTGDLTFSGGLRVDGTIRGNVQEQAGSQGTIILGENGRIEGAVGATKIVLIGGTVVGQVKAGQFIELQAKARIKGDLHYTSLEMHMGSVIDGKLVHSEKSEANETDEPI
jgi:cytoskeletal protein CcmA (bactofilin family)|tara:strand:+ start:11248 stop:11655 length:408 start_codon:yes stop_codon:yes gene_type:complete